MKISIGASSIVSLGCFFLLAACEEVHMPRVFDRDEVPKEVKEQAVFPEKAPSEENPAEWPRLGDVPFKPKTFSPEQVSAHYIQELERERSEAEAAKANALSTSPAPENAAPQNNTPENSGWMPGTQVPNSSPTPSGALQPPAFSR